MNKLLAGVYSTLIIYLFLCFMFLPNFKEKGYVLFSIQTMALELIHNN